ncbi:leukocyte elastase inhibitor A-like [Lutzomyia longipalpis]|uniref:Putative serpin n=1 Tax=Lutzomyia longipalpis TaxID=7200 RepID=A0A1B0CVZ9_LUTLO|nr:leukocyte elastase inhibitor A-like [Lutzomyia longipalpis]
MTEKLQFLMKLNEFATQLYRICASGKADENIVIAPFFLQNLLTATLYGSRGKTSEELFTALMYSGQNLTGIAVNFRDLNSSYRDTVSIAVANKLLIREPAQMDEQFPSDARRNFDISIQSFSNREKSCATVESVNKWVAEKTHQNVKECIRRGLDFDASSDSIVLVNAAHFGAVWEHKFAKQDQCTFWIDDNHSKNVDFMFLRTNLRFSHCTEISAQILELDFADDDFAMVFVLPEQRTGIIRLIEQLPNINLMYAVAQLRRQDVKVRMPRFKIDHGSRMREALLQLGVRDLFSEETADVSGIVTDESFYVSEIIHRVSVAIADDGEEIPSNNTSSNAPQEFIADHPFLFFIKHKCNVVFIGHVANPIS